MINITEYHCPLLSKSSVMPLYLTLSLCLSGVCLSVTEKMKTYKKNWDTRRWPCTGGKHTATCDRVKKISYVTTKRV